MSTPTDVLSRNKVTVLGDGPRTLLFAHGFGCDQSLWRFIAPPLARDYRVVLFDYVGSGGSDASEYDSERYAQLDGYAQDVLDVCEALDLDSVVFVGHSVGAMIGALAAIQQPDRFERLIMIGPSPCYFNDPPLYAGGFEKEDLDGLLDLMEVNDLGWASVLAPAVAGNPDRPELAAEMHGRFCAMDPVVAHEFARATFNADLREVLPLVSVPTLVLQCRDDALAPEAVGQYVARTLPQGALIHLQARGHCPHLSDPHETETAIRSYLDATH